MKLQHGIKFCHYDQGLHNVWGIIWLTFMDVTKMLRLNLNVPLKINIFHKGKL